MKRYFNTSHVVVYRETVMVRSNMHEQFQYISCCSLSCVYNGRRKLLLNFNTSHVVVYHLPFHHATTSCFISIHLML